MLQAIKVAGSVLTALASAAAAGTNALASVEYVHQQLVGYRGDLTGDGSVDGDDVTLLAAFLEGSVELPYEELQPYADLDHSGTSDARDLTLLKRLILTGAEPEEVYSFSPISQDLIPAPISAVHPHMPSIGDVCILMVAVDFPDCVHTENLSVEEIHSLTFGEERIDDHAYPMDSITAYYERASYGRLHLAGDVYRYTAQHPIGYYVNNTDVLVSETLSALDSQINYLKYDANGDSVMDTLLMALPGSASDDDWWPCSGDCTLRQSFDGVRPGNLCIGSWALGDPTGFNSTWIHELGHAMGLPDYYKYENYSDYDYYGLNGDAGTEMMDDAFGDMCAFSKLMLGWYAKDEVQIYTGGTKQYTLEASSQHMPGCILIPKDDLNDFHSEYIIIESVTNDGNNTAGFYENYKYPLFETSGIRVMHCTAELWEGYWGTELKWNNYGQKYDNSNQKQRVLRLVNEGNGFFGNGAVIDNQTSGFGWYDSSGFETVDPGVVITISDLDSSGKCTVTVSPKS